MTPILQINDGTDWHFVNGDWQDIQVFRDIATTRTCNNTLANQVKGGNSSERYYALSNAGDTVYIVFSKPEDRFQKLYYNFYRDGKALLKQPLMLKTSTVVNAFEWITGFRNNEVEGGVMFLTYGERNQSKSPKRSGTIQLWRLGVGGNTVSFGTGCQGNLKQVPRLRTDSAPSIGANINVLLDRHPNIATLFLAFGFSCQKLDLSFMGAPGCAMETTFPIILGTRVGAQGALTIPFKIPNNSSLLNSGANMQSFVSAVGANAAGALTSNAIALRF